MVKTWTITVEGIVQGVGFRPHLLKQSKLLNIPIEIGNSSNGVEVILNAENENIAYDTINQLVDSLPAQAKILGMAIKESEFRLLKKSKLIYPQKQVAELLITPDFSWCSKCKNEFIDDTNRRKNFLFISCTQCGPRFSVLKKLPFERENTTHYTNMCSTCVSEYENLDEVRSLSQLNACDSCFPKTHLVNNSTIIDVQEQINFLSKLIREGHAVVVQGIAGFLLLFDYLNEEIIRRTRLLKQRATKPFALMFADLHKIESNFYCSDKEKELLMSPAAPIVLLRPKNVFSSILTFNFLSGPSCMVGVMLAPSAYLYRLCISNGGALVATSANLSGYPLAYDKITADHLLTDLASEAFYYDRRIHFPQDDSVVQITPVYHHSIILRRSRGYAPSLKAKKKYITDQVVLSLGADLKSTFTLAYKKQLLISPYQGNLSSYDNFLRVQQNISKTLELCNVKPNMILLDAHPMFQSGHLFQDIVDAASEIKLIKHHQAHACAILGEHHLFENNLDVMCVVMDGLGYDSPDFIPGAAVYKYNNNTLSEVNHYPVFQYLFNDKMSLLPELSLFSILEGEPLLGREYFLDEHMQKNAVRMMPSQPRTNSIGRVYDALAALLGFTGVNSFEGEAALWLDKFAREGIRTYGVDGPFYSLADLSWIDAMKLCWEDFQKGVPQMQIVYAFLNGLTIDIVDMVKQHKINNLAVSGGVFQNVVLVDLLIANSKRNNINLYLHKELSPNDENISFGQYMHHLYIKSLN